MATLKTRSFRRGKARAIALFHGYGANCDDLLPLKNVLDPTEQWDWFFPNAPHSLPASFLSTGYAWFPINAAELEQHLAAGTFRSWAERCPDEFIQASQIAKGFVDELARSYDEIILGGFSQGAMVATDISLDHGPHQKALIILSGLLLAKDRWEQKLAAKAAALPVFQSHGEQDPLLGLNQAKELQTLLQQHHWPLSFHSFRGGHEIPPPIVDKLANFLSDLSGPSA